MKKKINELKWNTFMKKKKKKRNNLDLLSEEINWKMNNNSFLTVSWVSIDKSTLSQERFISLFISKI